MAFFDMEGTTKNKGRTNGNLSKAKKAKNDEFYTQLTDIEKELMHYKEHFKDKVVYCNCDDPAYSNFWVYFHLNFEFLGLKKLVATFHHIGCSVYAAEYAGGNDNDCTVFTKIPLTGNGDFRSDECVEILKQCDIVVTNPPFSLFREYVAQLIEYEKKFLIIGNANAITYKEFFPLLKNNLVWWGVSLSATKCNFIIPEGCSHKNERNIDGKRLVGINNAVWYTNLDHKKRHEKLIMYKKYTPQEYPTYDNYDAINVDKVADIPMDYDGVMGVPITFLGKFNPSQFEIVALMQGGLGDGLVMGTDGKQFSIFGKGVYARILIRKVIQI